MSGSGTIQRLIEKGQESERENNLEGELLVPQLIYETAVPAPSASKVPLAADILARAQKGDPDAFTELFHLHHAQIFTYLVHLVGRREEAEDLAQETFIKAWRALHTLHDDTRFSAWLYRVATSTALDHLRLQKRGKLFWLQPPEEISFEQEDTQQTHFAEQIAETEHIQATLLHIPHQYRVCLLLYYEVGCTQREIATILKMSEKNVNVYVRRGCEYFRRIYQGLEKGSVSITGRRSHK